MKPNTPVALEPTETLAAVISGWAVTWTLMTAGIPKTPAILAGLVIWAATIGRYRRRWTTAPGSHPEPGS